MAEIKNNFTQGKMNKDLDERLVPNGQYRDAMNIQVTSSDENDVGTVQNILGNQLISASGIPNDCQCVGVVKDEKSDVFYWFLHETTSINISTYSDIFELEDNYIEKDMILQYKNNIVTPVFVDKRSKVVKASPFTTGINPNIGTIPILNLSTAQEIQKEDIVSYIVDDTGGIHEINSPVLNVDITNPLFPGGVIYISPDDIPISLINILPGQPSLAIVFDTSTLKFAPNKIITAINVVDDFLFWSNGYFDEEGSLIPIEPKKINISKSIQGTNPDMSENTFVINESQNIGILDGIKCKEEDITVIKKSPLFAPSLKLQGLDDSIRGYSNVVSAPYVGQEFTIDITPINSSSNIDFSLGDTICLNQSNGFPFTPDQAQIRGSVVQANGSQVVIRATFVETDLDTGDVFYIVLDTSEKKLYKLKFPRFALRYKYRDNEYSAFSSFTNVAFLPGSFNFSPNEGYNLGMENDLEEIEITNIVQGDIPKEVKKIEILYKESDSPNVYKLDSLSPTDEQWINNKYILNNENIDSLISSNQLLRPWDNVPRAARAQEIIGSRLIYGNYLQNYDFDTTTDLTVLLRDRELQQNKKSIKSSRKYQLGIVYADKYQRQTPVFTNASGNINVGKLESGRNTQIVVKNNTPAPSWADSFKFFIKETSTEYYNLALDRFFDAEDGNIWLSFASSDRNKIDTETTLFLKKKLESDVPEESSNVYKVLAVENEAPEYIKTRKVVLGEVRNISNIHNSSSIFLTTNGTNDEKPAEGEQEIKIKKGAFTNTLLEDFHEKQSVEDNDKVLFIRFIGVNADGTKTGNISDYFEIDNVKVITADVNNQIDDSGNIVNLTDVEFYQIRLKKQLVDNDNGKISWMDTTSGSVTMTYSTVAFGTGAGDIQVEITQEVVQNKSAFQGRFFAKIRKDQYIENTIVATSSFQQTKIVQKINAYYAKNFTENDTPGTQSLSPWPFSFSWRTAADHATEIASWNANHGDPHTPIPEDAYCSWYAWRGIYEILRDTNDPGHSYGAGGFIIDEAYHAGEEPFWGLNGFDPDQETTYFGDVNDVYKNSSTLYGGYNAIWVSTNAYPIASNLYALMHQEKSGNPFIGTSNNFAQLADIGFGVQGLGHGPVGFSSNLENYQFFSQGAGVTSNTIDISYVGPYGSDINKTSFRERLESHNGGCSDFSFTTGLRPVSTDGGTEEIWGNYWKISESYDPDAHNFAKQIKSGAFIRFTNDPNSIIYTVTSVQKFYKFNYHSVYTGGVHPYPVGSIFNPIAVPELNDHEDPNYNQAPFSSEVLPQNSEAVDEGNLSNIGVPPLTYTPSVRMINRSHHNRRITWRLTLRDLNGDPPDWTDYHPITGLPGSSDTVTLNTNPCGIEIVTNSYILEDNEVKFPENPAVFETEPKTDEDLSLYYEASSFIPTRLSINNVESLAPVSSEITSYTSGVQLNEAKISGWAPPINVNYSAYEALVLQTTGTFEVGITNKIIKIQIENGSFINLKVLALYNSIIDIQGNEISGQLLIDTDISNKLIGLNWFNCFSFGNGVESDRVRDVFNGVRIDNGAKASTTIEEEYQQEHRKYGLIFSGIYNSISGVNNFNQFIMADSITKDINPTYGSIQKLFTRDTDLVTFCEDRVLKVLANKDALFNADGSTNVVASSNVLGQTMAFVGDYGISKNPESFASESYRAYFTDKQRGSVLRLSMDGLTPISEAGMSYWFGDNLKNYKLLIGSYDIDKGEYNLTLTNNFSEEIELDVTNTDSYTTGVSSSGSSDTDSDSGSSNSGSTY